ncbi:MAG: hypothetical protein N2110_05720 [Flavobacteriales bacterium]|nr:hypothetical protein [Flavobacteriales bacterium]
MRVAESGRRPVLPLRQGPQRIAGAKANPRTDRPLLAYGTCRQEESGKQPSGCRPVDGTLK